MDDQERGGTLLQRAAAFVQERGGVASERDIAAHLFRAPGHPDPWIPILRSALASQEILVPDGAGAWRLSEHARPARRGEIEYVVVDAKTTGLHPAANRIFDLAIIVLRDGREVEVFAGPLNPERKLPRFAADLTGLVQDDLAVAPTFEQVAARVVRMLDGRLIVAHDAGFVVGFLNAELRRAGRLPVNNLAIDLLEATYRLLPSVTRPSLDVLAEALGIVSRTGRRAERDARLAVDVFARLADLAREGRLEGLADIADLAGKPRRNGTWRSLLDAIVEAPGVYVMRDEAGIPLYVGKGRNLRSRVATYFSRPISYVRGMDGLLRALSDLETIPTGSELGALLLESRLIRQYKPRYNVQRGHQGQRHFVKAETNRAFGCLRMTADPDADGARYFGPFRTESDARALTESLSALYGLPTCGRVLPPKRRKMMVPCIRLDQGLCSGACAGMTSEQVHGAGLNEALQVLSLGVDGESLLRRRMAQVRPPLDQIRAANLAAIVEQAIKALGESRETGVRDVSCDVAVILPPYGSEADDPQDVPGEVVIVKAGRALGMLHYHGNEEAAAVALGMAGLWAGDLPATGELVTPDEERIVLQWVHLNPEDPLVIRLAPEVDGRIDWQAVAESALVAAQKAPMLYWSPDYGGTDEWSTDDGDGPDLTAMGGSLEH